MHFLTGSATESKRGIQQQRSMFWQAFLPPTSSCIPTQLSIYKYLLRKTWRQEIEDLFLVVCVIQTPLGRWLLLRGHERAAWRTKYGCSGGRRYLRSYPIAKVGGWLRD
jgi:hypothetical protein